MKFYSTNNRALRTSLHDAVLRGLAPDGGLFMPEKIPPLSKSTLSQLRSLSLSQFSTLVAKPFLDQDLTASAINELIADAINFPAPLVKLTDTTYVLELFHGPTLAFKDFGARFMSRLIANLRDPDGPPLTVLVATSGDTGSAVAYGFYNVPGIRVVLLYPSGQVSTIQEKQLTTLGGNVTALEVTGTFDDCQRLVKQAFADNALRKEHQLTSANSINIARLLPQSFYYFHAAAQFPSEQPLVFSVPSGNFGNLTAGIFAKRMGLPVAHFVAGTNANDIFPQYLQTGVFTPRPSTATISNAMDVGNPNNFPRIVDLYGDDLSAIRGDIFGARFSDAETREAIGAVYREHNYVIDPHTAVAYLALKKFQLSHPNAGPGVVLSTAHPAKFLDVVEPLLGTKIQIPERLAAVLDEEKRASKIPAEYSALKTIIAASH